MKCNNCNSERISNPFEVTITDLDNAYWEVQILIKCFDCGFIGEDKEFLDHSALDDSDASGAVAPKEETK